jgi:hypothetical protein
MQQLGIAEATEAVIKSVLADEYPDGHRDVKSTDLLMAIFRSLERRNPPDNVTG